MFICFVYSLTLNVNEIAGKNDFIKSTYPVSDNVLKL